MTQADSQSGAQRLVEAAIQRQRELLIPIDESALRRRWVKDDDEFADAEA